LETLKISPCCGPAHIASLPRSTISGPTEASDIPTSAEPSATDPTRHHV
jgi:hypothetical protein